MTIVTSKVIKKGSKPKYTFCQENRWWYFRHPLIGVSRIKGAPGDSQFHREYADKLAQLEQERTRPTAKKDILGSLSSLVTKYQASPEFKRLAPATREGYESLLAYAEEKIGDLAYQRLEKKHMVVLRNSLSKTPRKADHTMSALSAVFTWKIDQEDEELNNPCRGLKKLHRAADVVGYIPWTEDQIEFFLQHCAPHFVVPVMLGLHTGQRLGDCVTMSIEQLTGTTLTVITGKTKEFIEVFAHPELLQALKDRPYPDQDVFVVGIKGSPYKSPRAFSRQLASEMRRLKLPKLTFHGLRYAACGRLEDIGCTPFEVEDIVGHRTYSMAKKYMSKRRTREKVQSLLDKSAKSDDASDVSP